MADLAGKALAQELINKSREERRNTPLETVISAYLYQCIYPERTACLIYCPAAGSIVEVKSGRSMVPPPEVWQRRAGQIPEAL